MHLGDREVQHVGDRLDVLAGDVTELLHHVVEHRHQRTPLGEVLRGDGAHERDPVGQGPDGQGRHLRQLRRFRARVGEASVTSISA